MLTKNQLKILGFLGKNITKEYSFSDIKRELKMNSHSNLQKTLNKLSHENLVLKRQIGTSKLYRLNIKNSTLFNYLTIYNNILPEKVRISINHVKEALKKQMFYSIILFGSYANKTYKKESDLDVAILIPTKSKKNLLEAALNKASNKSLIPLDYHIFTEEEFEELLNQDYENVAKEIKNNNLPVFNAESFYNIILKQNS